MLHSSFSYVPASSDSESSRQFCVSIYKLNITTTSLRFTEKKKKKRKKGRKKELDESSRKSFKRLSMNWESEDRSGK